MKITMNMDCTPEEARTLFGLPDVKPMQESMMREVEARMKKALAATEPDALIKMWLPAGMQGLEQWQKMIWSMASSATKGGHTGKDAAKKEEG